MVYVDCTVQQRWLTVQRPSVSTTPCQKEKYIPCSTSFPGWTLCKTACFSNTYRQINGNYTERKKEHLWPGGQISFTNNVLMFLLLIAFILLIFPRTSINFLLMNLAVADMTAAAFFLPQFIFLSSSGHPDGASGSILCRLVTGGTLAYIGGVASVVTLVAIATERYNAVIHPLENRGKLTDRKMKVRSENVVHWSGNSVKGQGNKRGMPRCSLRLEGYACLRGLRKKRTGTTYRGLT